MSTFGERLNQAIKDHRYSLVKFSKILCWQHGDLVSVLQDKQEVTEVDMARVINALPRTDARWLICGEEAQ